MLRVFLFLLPLAASLSITTLQSRVAKALISSPLYKPISERAKDTMKQTAESAGIDWNGEKERIRGLRTDWDEAVSAETSVEYPDYYQKPFHTYPAGNLELDAALEQRLASAAVGVRNYPQYSEEYGYGGEKYFRSTYYDAIKRVDSTHASASTVNLAVDFGCGTGTSTEDLKKLFPDAEVIGIDQSPHMVVVGRELVSPNVTLKTMPMESTSFADNSVDLVSICLCFHECTKNASLAILKEARRILKPEGRLTIMEMDGKSPGFQKLRANPFLFSIIGSTEPHLEEYFDQVDANFPELVVAAGFSKLVYETATSRHYCAVATGIVGDGDFELEDNRDFELMGRLDQHMSAMSKSTSQTTSPTQSQTTFKLQKNTPNSPPSAILQSCLDGWRKTNFNLPLLPPIITNRGDALGVDFEILRLPPGLRERITEVKDEGDELKIVYKVVNPGYTTAFPVSAHEGRMIMIDDGEGGTDFTWEVDYVPLPFAGKYVELMTSSIVTSAFNSICDVAATTTSSEPDYLVTDSFELSEEERPSLIQSMSNPRDILASTLLIVGFGISGMNVVGAYGETYRAFEGAAIFLGFASAIAAAVQINTGYMITRRGRIGIADDASVNFYGGVYTAAVSWLAWRASALAPQSLSNFDPILAPLALLAFGYGIYAPVTTLYKYSNDKKTLSDTELLRVNGLLAIGVLGAVFAPDCVAFGLGSSTWWDRVSLEYPSQQTLESSTSLFALFATEASMVAHRAGKQGVAPFKRIVPSFVGVCFVLAIAPCIAALYWLGSDISYFSYYTT